MSCGVRAILDNRASAALRSKAPAEALRADLATIPELLKREIPVFDEPLDI